MYIYHWIWDWPYTTDQSIEDVIPPIDQWDFRHKNLLSGYATFYMWERYRQVRIVTINFWKILHHHAFNPYYLHLIHIFIVNII
jgi:hypothetical protein